MFRVLVSKQGRKFLTSLEGKKQEKVIKVLETLESNPLPFRIYDMKKLRGMANSYRIRIGNIRITYELFLNDFVIKVRYIGYRSKAYKKR